MALGGGTSPRRFGLLNGEPFEAQGMSGELAVMTALASAKACNRLYYLGCA